MDREWRVNHVWRAARIEALRRSPACTICGTTERLEVHHRTWNPQTPPYCTGPWNRQSNLTVLCREHHRWTHRLLRAEPGTQLALPIAA